ncbi:bestrophin-like domain [Paraburkholderia diazotrophica]|uniref:DUF4239 domain-containing protein n=1 Tax=Paraburkholderia diazotrophica TaxID=667676 RepID=A0A1H6YKX9_9BURK|nr:hypothetical protein [Paraburkholderia diazotrophica]SEJ40494.1 hypothetical protein SAMN05192539_1010132 [Paraburkholderia diazotrophica]
MTAFVDHPAVLFIVLLVLLVAAIAFGAFVLRRLPMLSGEHPEDFNIVQTSTLTLLALLIGFSLSMAVNRYDQRKNLEESEANAIGTEYARADLAGHAITAQMKAALVRYTRLRRAHYLTRDAQEIARNERETADLQSELWRLAAQVANENPTPVAAVIVTGMNDVLNSQDYSEAALINRIPIGAWLLMFVVALFGCVVQGYGAKGELRRGLLIAILPITVALSLALIADIDSPRGGIIHVQPQNLARLLQSLEK